MSVVLSHESAYHILLENRYLSQSIRQAYPPNASFQTPELLQLKHDLFPNHGRMHILSPDGGKARRLSPEFHVHYCGKLYNTPAFLQFHNAYVSSPELVFVQMAAKRTVAQAALAGYKLCGDYRPSAERFKTGEQPLTSTERIASFTDSLPSIKGKGNALTARRYVIDGSNSPQESRLALAAILPTRCGGFELPKPILNMDILGTNRTADLCWPEQGLILEYDSRQHHHSDERLDKDSARSVQIELKDYYVISVRPAQLHSFEQYRQLWNLVAQRLGVRKRTEPANHEAKQQELWTELYVRR